MIIYTATNSRPDVANLWFTAMRATLQQSASLIEAHVKEPTGRADIAIKIDDHGIGNSLWVVRNFFPDGGLRAFIEEDVIPVVPWSLDDYPGDLRFLDALNGTPWPAFTIARVQSTLGPFELIPQRYVREGGCPDWLPPELCEQALAADAKIIGNHFLHIDKLYRDTPQAAEKTKLIALLTDWFHNNWPQPAPESETA